MVADEQVNFFPDVSGECCLRIVSLPDFISLLTFIGISQLAHCNEASPQSLHTAKGNTLHAFLHAPNLKLLPEVKHIQIWCQHHAVMLFGAQFPGYCEAFLDMSVALVAGYLTAAPGDDYIFVTDSDTNQAHVLLPQGDPACNVIDSAESISRID